MSVSRRFFTLSGIAAIGVLAAGCDEETARRKAFIRFLQTRIVDRPGLEFPVVQDEEFAAFGHYLTHFHVMRRFHNTLNALVSPPLQQALKAGAVMSFRELVNRRDEISTVRDGMLRMRDVLDKAEADADADRAKLTQTRDLETVYTAAYQKLVTGPARTIRGVIPSLEGTLQAGRDIADYLVANRADIALRGPHIETDNPEHRRRLAELLKALDEKSSDLDDAQHRLRLLVRG